MLLQLNGCEAQICVDPRDVWAALEAFCPTDVVLDIGMPFINGYELARMIRRDKEFYGIRIIAVTGYGTKQDKERAQKAGCDHHLTKPASIEEILKLVRV